MRFDRFVVVLEELERTSSGNKLREILASFFRKVPKNEIGRVAYLLTGRIAPESANVNIGMAAKMVLRSISMASGKDISKVNVYYKKKGDVGITAQDFAQKQRKVLTVKEVFDGLHRIVVFSGAGSQDRKVKELASLLRSASPREARFLVRMVTGKLRLGIGDKAVLDALSMAFTGSKEARSQLEHAYNLSPDVGEIAEKMRKGLKEILKISPSMGRPIQMMLCQRVGSLAEVFRRIGSPVAVEGKYDGERVQAHISGKNVTLFSRRLENITAQFPDVSKALLKAVKVRNCIIEGEIMPVSPKGRFLPFQSLMQRKRKHGVEEYVKKVPVCLFLFDCLSVNRKSIMNADYGKRYIVLKKSVRPSRIVCFADRIVCRDVKCVDAFFKKCLKKGLEGVVIKSLQKESLYRAGVRGFNWIKWKPEYVKGLQDTFDLVVVGAYMGRGRRAGAYGALLCAAYNRGKFETVCKVGSGFSDKDLAGLPRMLDKFRISGQPKNVTVHRNMRPDVWFRPGMVVEVLAAEITYSPYHTAGLQRGRGLALRFPRFVRFREKLPRQATSVKEILRMKKISR